MLCHPLERNPPPYPAKFLLLLALTLLQKEQFYYYDTALQHRVVIT